ncbi:TIGR04551 family protein [Vulgatibacter sp.]|uniref:TIGR04551 family protein n=1 Tax=Vulgatibacter sp. TaxID=1971226 RepID=UPI0035641C65
MIRPLAASGGIALASLVATPVLAQQAPPPRDRQPAAEQAAPSTGGTQLSAAEREALREQLREELSAEFEQRLETAREEMRDEVRAAVTSAGAASEWEEEWEDVRPQLDFLELDGYFRTRMDVFNDFDLGTGPDAAGFTFYPVDPRDPDANTIAGANMRLRIDPTLNVSEEIRIRAQIDIFDNLVFGATPRAGFAAGIGNQRYPYAFLTDTQATPEFGFNSVTDSIVAKRAWAEVRTPIGELRFGRMPNQFGLGMNINDGNCIDCDHGDTVDRFMFATRIADHVIAPAIDFVSEGPTTADPWVWYPNAQPVDRTQSDDATDYVLVLLRRDDDEEIRRMRTAGKEVFVNYGLYFTYREQSWDAPTVQVGGPTQGNGGGGGVLNPSDLPLANAFVARDAWAVMPDLWFRLLYKSFRLELEFVTVQGEIGNRSLGGDDVTQTQSLDLQQYGAVLQNEIALVDDKLRLGLEIGFASGDDAPGFGNFPGRTGSGEGGFTRAGDWEGPQFACAQAACSDDNINNFRFDRDYHVDLILFREILGGVTDATYVKPSVNYDVTEGLGLNLGIVYSQANSADSTPTGNRPLGVEIDAAVNYLSDDGFVASIAYGVLFPLSGLDQIEVPGNPASEAISAETAQAVRGFFGIIY